MAFPSQSFAYNYVFPSGTSLLFQQSNAPLGWTKVTAYNNYALRVVSGTAGTGGTVAFTTAFASQAVSGTNAGTAISAAQLASHTHGASSTANSDPVHSHQFPGAAVAANQAFLIGAGGQVTYGDTASVNNTNNTSINHSHGGSGSTGSAGSDQTHTHTFTGTPINLAVQYVDTIIATKN